MADESFESKLAQIKQTVEALARDDILMQEAVAEYKKGVKLIAEADKILQEAQIVYEELNAKDD